MCNADSRSAVPGSARRRATQRSGKYGRPAGHPCWERVQREAPAPARSEAQELRHTSHPGPPWWRQLHLRLAVRHSRQGPAASTIVSRAPGVRAIAGSACARKPENPRRRRRAPARIGKQAMSASSSRLPFTPLGTAGPPAHSCSPRAPLAIVTARPSRLSTRLCLVNSLSGIRSQLFGFRGHTLSVLVANAVL